MVRPDRFLPRTKIFITDPTNAGAVERSDSRRPKPRNLNGKVACVQLLSEIPQHKILLRHSRNLRSKCEGKEPKEEDGTQRKR